MLPFERWRGVYQHIEEQRKAQPLPEVVAGLAGEDDAAAAKKHALCMAAVGKLRDALQRAKPDVVVIFGDDQLENFTADAMPPFAMFAGDATFGYPFKLLKDYWGESPGERVEVKGDRALADVLLRKAAERGFELTYSRELPNKEWGLPHSVTRLAHLLEIKVPIVPVFVNALYEPAATPARCYQLGVAFREILEAETPKDRRIVVIGSGGLSHTPRGDRAGYINVKYDERLMGLLRAGKGKSLADQTIEDLYGGANHELREWLPALACAGDRAPTFLEYVVSWRMVAGYGFAAWETN